jgi:hypothetical protein
LVSPQIPNPETKKLYQVLVQDGSRKTYQSGQLSYREKSRATKKKAEFSCQGPLAFVKSHAAFSNHHCRHEGSIESGLLFWFRLV